MKALPSSLLRRAHLVQSVHSVFLALKAKATLFVVAAIVVLALPGCACISGGEYGSQCCSACGILCTQTCLPICIDTALGQGPFNSSAQALAAESEPAPLKVNAATAVAY